MNKEEILLKNFTLLSKDAKKNKDALKSAINQLIEINPKLGIRCWEECINDNLSEIEEEFGKDEFSYNNLGYYLIKDFEMDFCEKEYFKGALDEFAKNKSLLDIIYTKSPIYNYFGARYAISFLIRADRLQEADNILSAIYKNKTFSDYSYMWDSIIDMFKYEDEYNPGAYFSNSLTQPDHIRDFCIGWIERIKDEEEQASAMTFAMQMF